MNKGQRRSFSSFLFDNKVSVLFIVLCIGSFFASGQSLIFLFRELFTRIGRNTFLVLSLLIPILTGMGLNFGIVIGAIAAQIATFCVAYWGVKGVPGLLLAVLLSTPIAMFFGYLVGSLFNRMKGAEMIGGMVLGYFSDGLYQFLFLFIIGGVIKVNPASRLIISGGIGVRNSIDLKDSFKYALDNLPLISIVELFFYVSIAVLVITLIYRAIKKQDLQLKKTGVSAVALVVGYALTFIPAVDRLLSAPRMILLTAVEIALVGIVLFRIIKYIISKANNEEVDFKTEIIIFAVCLAIYALTYIPVLSTAMLAVQLPMVTYLCIALLAVFNSVLMRTKLGQNMRTVGQNRTVANAAGINVNQTRIIAMILSTIFASWGQIISLQNIGTFSTYGAHTYLGQFTIAALLVGGASVHKATNQQAIVGVILFHTLFILSPLAGKELFGNAQIGEYFRVFVAYGVIAVSLAMHAWKGTQNNRLPEPRTSKK